MLLKLAGRSDQDTHRQAVKTLSLKTKCRYGFNNDIAALQDTDKQIKQYDDKQS